ncbi:hypothetical protein NDU88_001682 [Pleurodeles waltl]|uniref:Uncharacterized protein n=1 Tax=Pleurodeles waltl TaxID=8319 RepID=A0AAV7NBH5_PLEWA|nr:hypothetical protein NDU88_001682 [Pleurodeles waltl]
MGAFGVSLEASVGASWVEGVEGGGVVAGQRGLGELGTRGRGAGHGTGADGRRRACLWHASGAPAARSRSGRHMR